MRRPGVWIALLLAVGIFLLDVLVKDFDIWEPYLLPLVIAYGWGRRRDIYAVAAACTALIVLSYALDVQRGAPGWVLANHLAQVGVLWLVAWLLAAHAKLEEQRVCDQIRLEELVRARTADLHQEIEERRQAQAAAERSEQRLRLLSNHAREVIWACDLEGRVTYVSPSVEQVLGYTPAEVLTLGLPPGGADQPQLTPELQQMVAAALDALAQGRPIDVGPYTVPQVRRDGAIVQTEVVLAAVCDGGGRPVGLSGSTRDITRRYVAELELRRLNEELEARVAQRTADLEAALAERQRVGKLKDEFMAMVSHELRTPLMGVMSLAEVLENQRAGPLNARQLTYVQSIGRSGQRLHTLVNSILSYTDLLAGNVHLAGQWCEVAALAGGAAAAIQSSAAEKDQTVSVEVAPQGLAVETDGAALRQVLDRLLLNAVKFTPAGGRVGIAAADGPDAEHVQIVVWDTGIGMEHGQLAQAVSPFTQMGATLTRSHDGMGLGLAYAHQMLLQLHGQLALESAPAQGSRFVVTLPRRWQNPPADGGRNLGLEM